MYVSKIDLISDINLIRYFIFAIAILNKNIKITTLCIIFIYNIYYL